MAPRLLALAGFLGLSALATTALAGDPAAAKLLFERGVAQMEAGRYDEGCPAVAESYRLDPRPGTLFTLAECEAKRGRPATAVERYDEYLALVKSLPPDKKLKQGDREKIALQQRASLGPEIPRLTVTLPSDAPKGLVVKRDGTVLSGAALGIELPVDPGEHVLTAELPGGSSESRWEQRLILKKGEKRQVTLKLESKVEPAGEPIATPATTAITPPVEGTKEGPSGRRIGAYVAGGVGLAALVLGGVMGGVTLGKKATIKDHCGAAIHRDDETACDLEGIEAASSAKTPGLVSSIGFGVGFVGLGAAAVLLLTEPKSPAKVASPRRPPAPLFWAAPAGGMVGVSGVW